MNFNKDKDERYLPGEKTVLRIKQSVFIVVRDMLMPVVGLGGIAALLTVTNVINPWMLLVLIALIILIDIPIFLNWYMTVFKVTDKRVESRAGIFAVAREEIYLEEIQSIDTKKSFWGLIFNFGDVVIEAAGHNVITFYRIANMKEVADTIADLSLTYTKKLGKNSKPPVEG